MKSAVNPPLSRSHAAIIDYLISFGISRIHGGEDTEYPRTVGASIGFVACFAGNAGAVVGDLIRLESAPASKWRLSWLMEIRSTGCGNSEWLCRSIIDGDLCWWSNVGVSYLHRPTVNNHPEWRWSDDQYVFHDKWAKAGHRNDAYLYRTVSPDFNEDGTATISTRVRHSISDERPSRIVRNWKKATIKSLSAIYLEMVEEHKSSHTKVAQ